MMKNKKEKINQFIQKMERKGKSYQYNKEKLKTIDKSKEKELKIIGISGSRGKSSVAYILHQFLKQAGYSSILYSSITIDSYISYKKVNEAVENPIQNEQILLEAIGEAKESNTEYLILEINERAISKGLIKEVPFDIRVLTNIYPKQNELYPDYIELKKSFLEDAKEEETLILGVLDEETSQLKQELQHKKVITYSSEYLQEHYQTGEVDYCVAPHGEVFHSILGLDFMVKEKDKNINLKTTHFMPYQAFNIVCVKAILDELKVNDMDLFQKIIYDIVIPGRDEVIHTNGRTIIISVNLAPQLEILKEYKEKKQVNEIIVVVGATGRGYKTWKEEFAEEEILKGRMKDIEFAYNYISRYADQLYITTTDIGSTNKTAFLDYQASLVKDKIAYDIVEERKEAIQRALLHSKEKDVIYISGRGNRRIMCVSKNKMQKFMDIEETKKILKEMKWSYNDESKKFL